MHAAGANTAMVPSLATMPLAMVLLLLSMLGESHSAAPHILFMLVGSRTCEAPAYWRCALPLPLLLPCLPLPAACCLLPLPPLLAAPAADLCGYTPG